MTRKKAYPAYCIQRTLQFEQEWSSGRKCFKSKSSSRLPKINVFPVLIGKKVEPVIVCNSGVQLHPVNINCLFEKAVRELHAFHKQVPKK
jgi:hypothetical protein